MLKSKLILIGIVSAGILLSLAPTFTQPALAALPPIKTVFVILMEGASWSHVKTYPYIKSLIPIAATTANYQAAPNNANTGGNVLSEPEYIWLEAGDNLGVTTDDDPSSTAQSTTAHLATQLNNAGVPWKEYAEDIPGTNCPVTNTGKYAVRHNPFMFFTDVINNSSYCIAHVRPYTELSSDLNNNKVSGYNFITPNLCDDMHDNCTGDTAAQGDTWLSQQIPNIMNSQAYKNGGAIFITWDDSGQSSSTPIGMIVLSPFAKAGYSNSIHYDHSSLLRTSQEFFGVSPFLRAAASTTDLSDLFNTNGTTPIPTSTPKPTSTPLPTSTPNSKPGDANNDGKVDGVDYVIWLNHYGQNIGGSNNGDFNNDGKVDGVDYVIWLTHYS